MEDQEFSAKGNSVRVDIMTLLHRERIVKQMEWRNLQFFYKNMGFPIVF